MLEQRSGDKYDGDYDDDDKGDDGGDAWAWEAGRWMRMKFRWWMGRRRRRRKLLIWE